MNRRPDANVTREESGAWTLGLGASQPASEATETSAVPTRRSRQRAEESCSLAALVDDIWPELMNEWSQEREPRQVTISQQDWNGVSKARSSERQSVHILGLAIVPSSALGMGMFLLTE